MGVKASRPIKSIIPKPFHTARYHSSEATIHYPFHARSGEHVEVVRRQQFRGRDVVVVQQRDGTSAHIPTWMCDSSAAALAVMTTIDEALDATSG